MKDNARVTEVKETADGELYIELTPEELATLGWVEGDTLVWTVNDDGSAVVKKKEA
jgi:formylmethanofuran dehydrogenase subunit D